MTDIDLHAFAPSGERAIALDARFHRELASSLTHLAEACSEDETLSKPLRQAAERLAANRRVPPLFFKTYFEIAGALFEEDASWARELAGRLETLPDRPAERLLHAYGDGSAVPLEDALGRDGDVDLAEVPGDTASAFATLLDEGFAMMAEAIPGLHAEINQTVREVLLAHSPAGVDFEFDGASHYQFWGLLLLNPKHHKTPLACVEVLAHEASHSLLFGLTIEEPLVFNPDEELYVSPLRPDPRPMDGIYHATYVSARMAWAMERMAEALSGPERDIALKAAAHDRANFEKGHGTVLRDGRLSDTGAAIMAAAEAAMKAT
ncbi:MAG: HEXXH motif-containing putative peptide modification protein [Pseudomonadota bacterium]